MLVSCLGAALPLQSNLHFLHPPTSRSTTLTKIKVDYTDLFTQGLLFKVLVQKLWFYEQDLVMAFLVLPFHIVPSPYIFNYKCRIENNFIIILLFLDAM